MTFVQLEPNGLDSWIATVGTKKVKISRCPDKSFKVDPGQRVSAIEKRHALSIARFCLTTKPPRRRKANGPVAWLEQLFSLEDPR